MAGVQVEQTGRGGSPRVPVDMKAMVIRPNALAVEWAQSERARHYRVWLKVLGVDQEFLNVGNPADPDFTIPGSLANAEVQVAVSAVNDGGESARSEIVTIALPA